MAASAATIKSMNSDNISDGGTIIPEEGLHVFHLFYRIDNGSWDLLSQEEKMEARTGLLSLIKEAREREDTQLLTFSMVTPKADIGFMLLTKDLHVANRLEKKLSLSLGPDILLPTFSYYSLTERSEYTTSSEEFRQSLVTEKGLQEGSEEFEQALSDFEERIAKYAQNRLYPVLPDWPVACFYPMSKRRTPQQNWYALDFAERKKLMAGHAKVGRTYAGRILQLITGSTGLDDMEWMVTLFANNPEDIKSIIYEMRFDPVSAHYAEFGEFYIGLQLPPGDIFARLAL